MGLLFCTVAQAAEEPAAGGAPEQAGPASAPGNAVADPSDPWHVGFTMYLWFPGVHGTTGAVNGPDIDFRASAGDLLSHFRFGLMGTVEAEHDRWVVISDLMWVRLQADHQRALPFPGVPELSAQFKAWELIVNPEVGYRFVNGERIKIDAIPFGIRYWHLGTSLQFTPSYAARTFSSSVNWVDPVMGARFQVLLSPKMLITVWGDAGGWGAGSQLDYQIVGAIAYKINPKFTAGVAYRYLYVNYVSGSALFKAAMSGPAVGVTYHFK
ncbi:MAG TPA: hypothetical protein VH351_16145 [Bryobacteraceae bacterium]|nr:hypothetical protein [Bryobacteraceae bacterium]